MLSDPRDEDRTEILEVTREGLALVCFTYKSMYTIVHNKCKRKATAGWGFIDLSLGKCRVCGYMIDTSKFETLWHKLLLLKRITNGIIIGYPEEIIWKYTKSQKGQ